MTPSPTPLDPASPTPTLVGAAARSAVTPPPPPPSQALPLSQNLDLGALHLPPSSFSATTTSSVDASFYSEVPDSEVQASEAEAVDSEEGEVIAEVRPPLVSAPSLIERCLGPVLREAAAGSSFAFLDSQASDSEDVAGQGHRLRSIVVGPAQPSEEAPPHTPVSEEQQWHLVKSKKQRREEQRSFAVPREEQLLQQRRRAYLKRMQGLCFKCLSPKHLVANCREKWRCWKCNRSGHKAKHCSDSTSVPDTAKDCHQPSSSMFVGHRSFAEAAMAGSSSSRREQRERPEEGRSSMTATQEMAGAEATFTVHAVIVWLGDNRPRTEPAQVASAFRQQFGVPAHEIQVSHHAPEDFLVFFGDPRKRTQAVNTVFSRGGRTYKVFPWRATRHTEEVVPRFKAKLCIENLPVHAWVRAAGEVIIGPNNALESIELSSLRRDQTETFDIWITTDDPFTIHRVNWFTIYPLAEGDQDGYSASLHQPTRRQTSSRDPSTGHTSRLLIHLDRYVDLSPGSTRQEILSTWCLGRVDGARDSNYVTSCQDQGGHGSSHMRDRDDYDDDRRSDRSAPRSEGSGIRGWFSRSRSKSRYEPYHSNSSYNSRRYNNYSANNINDNSSSGGPVRRRQAARPQRQEAAPTPKKLQDSQEEPEAAEDEVLIADDDCTLNSFLAAVAKKNEAAVLPTPLKPTADQIPEDQECTVTIGRRSACLGKVPNGASAMELKAMEFLAKGLGIIRADEEMDEAAKDLFAKMFHGPEPISAAAITAIEKLVVMIKRKVQKNKKTKAKGKADAAAPQVTEILSNG